MSDPGALAELLSAFQFTSTKDGPRSYSPSAYASCIKVNGRPILPPLMTPERRVECGWWRRKAVEVEKELQTKRKAQEEQQQRHQHETASSESEEDLVVISRSSRTITLSEPLSPDSSGAGKEIRSAFKTLVDRLRGSLSSSSEFRPPHHESLQSVDTVIENPSYFREEMSLEGQGEFRQRRNSYTLTEPSPLLQAYIDRYGTSDMSISSKMTPPRAKRVLPTPEELRKTREEQLEGYLNDISAMPVKLSLVKAKVITPNMKEMQRLEDELDDLDEEKLKVMPNKEEIQGLEDEGKDCDAENSIASSVVNSVSIHITSPPRASHQMKLAESIEAEEDTEYLELKSTSDPITTVETPFFVQPEVSQATPCSFRTDPLTKQIEEAVSSLAQEQQRRIQKLVEEQAKQRDDLQRVFQEQQQELITQIINTVQMTPLPFNLPRPVSPIVPAVAGHTRRSLSTLPPNYQLPLDAMTPMMHSKLCRLSALAKGYLTRRLLRTHKVQTIVSSMRDTTNMALQMHQEARNNLRPVSKQDVELHRGLLHQLNRYSASLHDIFFKLETREQMAIIAHDYEIIQKPDRERTERRVSSTTLAKLEQKKQQNVIKLQKERHASPKRRRMMALLTKDKENHGSRTKSLSDVKGLPKRANSQARRSLYNITAAFGSSSNAIPGPKTQESTKKKPWK